MPAGQTNDPRFASHLSEGVATGGSNMGIIRREKSENYSVIYNECFQDDRLSARAKGLFAYLMTLPDDWKIYKRELCKHFKEGRDALNKAFSELEDAGYVTKTAEQDAQGKMCGWDYTVYESTELLNNRTTENPTDWKSATTKYSQEQSTKDTKSAKAPKHSKPDGTEVPAPKAKRFQPPRRAEVAEYMQEYAKKAPPRQVDGFLDYHESRGWMVGKNKMRDWKAAVRTWIRHDFDGEFAGKSKPGSAPEIS